MGWKLREIRLQKGNIPALPCISAPFLNLPNVCRR